MNTPQHPKPKTDLQSIGSQLKQLTPFMFLFYTPILLGLAGLVAVYLIADIPMRLFFIDPVAEFNAPMYIGLISNLGVLLWGAAASVCLFGGWLCLQSEGHREKGWFLTCAGLISAMLMLDDLYLLHEEVIEDHLFIPQEFVFLAYGVMVLCLLVRFRKLILSTDYLLLLLAFVFLATSIAVDVFVKPEEFTVFGDIPGRHIIEDGFKLLGIATWSVYFVRTSMQLVAPLVRKS